jgi:hypothetical protein
MSGRSRVGQRRFHESSVRFRPKADISLKPKLTGPSHATVVASGLLTILIVPLVRSPSRLTVGALRRQIDERKWQSLPKPCSAAKRLTRKGGGLNHFEKLQSPTSAFHPLRTQAKLISITPMEFRTLIAALTLCFALSACGDPVSRPLPPLLQGASTTGGTNSLCERRQGKGSTPETASHSPEIVQRLRRDFPVGSAAAKLREALSRQGFSIHDACSPDKSVSWAEFRQSGGNGITAMPAYGTVYWKQDQAGRLVWATGDIAFTGL